MLPLLINCSCSQLTHQSAGSLGYVSVVGYVSIHGGIKCQLKCSQTHCPAWIEGLSGFWGPFRQLSLVQVITYQFLFFTRMVISLTLPEINEFFV